MAIKDLYPDTRPSLNLDFANSKALDPRITFARNSTATHYDHKGTLVTAAANEPRFDHDPVTGESLGLLIEEQRTNLFTYSEQFDNAAWTKTRASISANAVIAPDGTLTADALTGDGTGSAYVYLAATLTQALPYSGSVYFKLGTYTVGNFEIRDFTEGGAIVCDIGTLVVTATGIASAPSVISVGGGWYRLSGVFTPTIATGNHNIGIVQTNAATTFHYIWGAQLEAGAFPTSYIPTEASQVTRLADSASMTGANFSDWVNAAEGTILAEYETTGWLTNNTPPTTSLDLTKQVDDYTTAVSGEGIKQISFYPRELTTAQITALTS